MLKNANTICKIENTLNIPLNKRPLKHLLSNKSGDIV